MAVHGLLASVPSELRGVLGCLRTAGRQLRGCQQCLEPHLERRPGCHQGRQPGRVSGRVALSLGASLPEAPPGRVQEPGLGAVPAASGIWDVCHSRWGAEECTSVRPSIRPSPGWRHVTRWGCRSPVTLPRGSQTDGTQAWQPATSCLPLQRKQHLLEEASFPPAQEGASCWARAPHEPPPCSNGPSVSGLH